MVALMPVGAGPLRRYQTTAAGFEALIRAVEAKETCAPSEGCLLARQWVSWLPREAKVTGDASAWPNQQVMGNGKVIVSTQARE